MCSSITSRTTSRVWRGTIQSQSSLRADSVVWLSHTSSVWPWSGTQKVRLYGTFIGGLWHCFTTTLLHLVRPTSWKHWPMRLNTVGPSSVSRMKYLGSNRAWLGTTCLVISRRPCSVLTIWHFKRLYVYSLVSLDCIDPSSKETLIQWGCSKSSLINLSGMPSAPREVLWVYQANWGVAWAFIRFDIVKI